MDLEALENELKEQKRVNESLEAELLQKENEYKDLLDHNESYNMYKQITNGDIDYQTLSRAGIPIPQDLQDIIDECYKLDNQYDNDLNDIKTILNLLVGSAKSKEIIKNDAEVKRIIEEYISISSEYISK